MTIGQKNRLIKNVLSNYLMEIIHGGSNLLPEGLWSAEWIHATIVPGQESEHESH